MSGRTRSAYWDTCCFIAWLKNEKGHPPGTLDALDEQARLCDRGEFVIVTSAITITEVLKGVIGIKESDQFHKATRRRHLQVVACDQRIAGLASEIRNDIHATSKPGTLVKCTTPDAIHLATAVKLAVDRMHTMDGVNGGGLLRWNGHPAVHGLRIAVPFVDQPHLPDTR